MHFAAEEAVISQTDQYRKLKKLYVRLRARTNVDIVTRLVCLEVVSFYVLREPTRVTFASLAPVNQPFEAFRLGSLLTACSKTSTRAAFGNKDRAIDLYLGYKISFTFLSYQYSSGVKGQSRRS